MMLAFSEKLNAFYGDNAAGKTSVLEAIYVLATTKSFRSSHQNVLVSHESPDFTVFSEIFDGLSVTHVGVSRNKEENVSRIHVNSEHIKSISVISQLVPVLFVGSDSHRILMDGPKVRRQFLDWGLFYTEPAFLAQWRAYQKLLVHRNAALKARVSREELLVWNAQLAEAGERLHRFRQAYVDSFLPFFKEMLSVFFDSETVSARYFPGWGLETPLLDCLSTQLSRELIVGHTLAGPHRADFIVTSEGLPAEELLSQGQQKLVSYALRLAQGVHLKHLTGKSAIFLIDDLPSELDAENQDRVMRILENLDAQVFVTGVYREDLEKFQRADAENKMFHVKHGAVECISECFT